MTGFRARNRMNRFHPDPLPLVGQRHARRRAQRDADFTYGISAQTPAWTWDQLAEAAARQDLPWIAKGILTNEAAEAALTAGASAILVSNHGGREVDPAPASLYALPEVAARSPAGPGPAGQRRPHRRRRLRGPGARRRAVVIGRLAAYGLAAAGERASADRSSSSPRNCARS